KPSAMPKFFLISGGAHCAKSNTVGCTMLKFGTQLQRSPSARLAGPKYFLIS
ncbi:unnamed protein product, partial [Nesidiocoris tenuis]